MHRLFGLVLLLVLPLGAKAQTLEVEPGRSLAMQTETHLPLSAQKEVSVSLRGHLVEANNAAVHNGKLVLTISADLEGPSPVHAVLQIPLASTPEAYGESRSCQVNPHGGITVFLTAGLDEKNFVPFAPGPDREFRFLVNKDLCRLLAAPFRCRGQEVVLPTDAARWRLGQTTKLVLESTGAPARAQFSGATFWTGSKPFSYADCAALAPSDGTCCVAGKTTAWHCGVPPKGSGWHQVSGSCFHRETGGRCRD